MLTVSVHAELHKGTCKPSLLSLLFFSGHTPSTHDALNERWRLPIIQKKERWKPQSMWPFQRGKRLTLEIANDKDWQDIAKISVAAGPAAHPIYNRMQQNINSPESQYFGEFWVGPYRELEPEMTFVIRDENQKVVGYLTGATNTAEFEKTKANAHTKKLREEAREGKYATADENFWHKEHSAAETKGEELEGIKNMFTPDQWATVYRDYPAHLHMNFLPDYQKGGLGGIILNRYLERLKSMNVKGVHLGCSQRAVGFYEKMGFKIHLQKNVGTEEKPFYTYVMVKEL